MTQEKYYKWRVPPTEVGASYLLTLKTNHYKQMKRIVKISGIVFLLLISFINTVSSQNRDTANLMMGVIEDGDTVIHVNLKEIWVMPPKKFPNRREERRYYSYVDKVKKVYPYAQIAGEKLREYEPLYLSLETDRERRILMKSIEEQLLNEYKDDMKKLTISEGHILIKLIDRETRRTSYSLIKDFRGGFSAFFWQSIARLFGSDLKVEYDPDREDRILEEIVMLIEVGYF